MESENVQPFTKQHVMNCLIIIYVKKNHTILSMFYTAFRFWINLNQNHVNVKPYSVLLPWVCVTVPATAGDSVWVWYCTLLQGLVYTEKCAFQKYIDRTKCSLICWCGWALHKPWTLIHLHIHNSSLSSHRLWYWSLATHLHPNTHSLSHYVQ